MLIPFLKSLFIFFGSIATLILIGLGIIKSIEYIEDQAYSAKKKIKNIIYGCVIAHLYFLIRGKSILHTAFSLSIQYSFFCLLQVYPIIKLDNPYFIYGTLASLVNHFLVIRFLFYRSLFTVEILSIFLLIWITPFCFFISLSANDEVIIVKGKTTVNTMIGNYIKKIINRKE
ncbi:testis expressed 261 (TEX261) [Vairimorpha necatrix]|uniref:Testis expressed 261 (TEX261) n=1 Tax=Vairimorpha necatrix TaxID=6039 RepID=A0AAX4J8S6_9MICR